MGRKRQSGAEDVIEIITKFHWVSLSSTFCVIIW